MRLLFILLFGIISCNGIPKEKYDLVKENMTMEEVIRIVETKPTTTTYYLGFSCKSESNMSYRTIFSGDTYFSFCDNRLKYKSFTTR